MIYITGTVYFGCLKGRCIDDEENKTVNSNVLVAVSLMACGGASFDGKCTVNGEKGRAHNMNYGEPKKQ